MNTPLMVQWCERCRRRSVGIAGRKCTCGSVMEELLHYRSRRPACEYCGEMIGRAQRWSGRWPLTVVACSCTDCGKGTCDRCSRLYQTDRIVGSHTRMTEGRHRISVPTFERIVLCAACCKRRQERKAEDCNSRLFECGECHYVGRYDTFPKGRTLVGAEYAKTCPSCGFTWEPSVMGILTPREQIAIRPAAGGTT